MTLKKVCSVEDCNSEMVGATVTRIIDTYYYDFKCEKHLDKRRLIN